MEGVVETDGAGADDGVEVESMRPRVLGPAKATGGRSPVPEFILEKEVEAGFDAFVDTDGADPGGDEREAGEAGGEREVDMDILFRG